MKKFLLDSDTCISFIRGNQNVKKSIALASSENCFLSEITEAELRFGAERCNRRQREHGVVDLLCEKFTVLPITEVIRTFAAEKARLWTIGQKIADFDLFIGATVLYHGLILVTNNTRHFERMPSIRRENWMQVAE